METRVQFRVESETKNLAMKALDKKGLSLSDALRSFLEKLASTEKVMSKEETWLKAQIQETFENVERGDVRYYSEEEAEDRMNSFMAALENRHEKA